MNVVAQYEGKYNRAKHPPRRLIKRLSFLEFCANCVILQSLSIYVPNGGSDAIRKGETQ